MNRTRALAVSGLLALSASGCMGLGALGGLGDVIGGSNSVYGEVRSVDARRGRIQVREQHGRNQTVRFDNRTQVVYQNRRYPVSSLERGDQVQMRVQYDRNNTAWADRIEVRSARRADRRDDRRNDRRDDRSVWGTRVQRLDGRVEAVDARRGYFTLNQNRGGRVVVYLPRNARREDVRRVERLRRGERVRVDVRSTGRGDQAELVRFR